jgi:hypothetical protein
MSSENNCVSSCSSGQGGLTLVFEKKTSPVKKIKETIIQKVPGMIPFNSGGTMFANATEYLHFGTMTTIESRGQFPASDNFTFTKLIVTLTNSPGIGNSITTTLRINGTNQSLAVTISDNATTGFLIVPVAVSLGQLISLQTVSSASLASGIVVMATLQYN